MFSLKPMDPETLKKLEKTMEGEHGRFQRAIRNELEIEKKKSLADPVAVAQRCPKLSQAQVEQKALHEALSYEDKRHMIDKDACLDVLAMAAKMMAEEDYPEAAINSNSPNNHPANPNWRSTSQHTTYEFEDFNSLAPAEGIIRLKAFKQVAELNGRQLIKAKWPPAAQRESEKRGFKEPKIEEIDDIKVEIIDPQFEAASTSEDGVVLLKKPKIEIQ